MTPDTKSVCDQLAKPLHTDAIKTRKSFGGGGNSQLAYIEAHHAIREANTIFGHLGWSRETRSCEIVCTSPYTKNGKEMVAVSYVARVRIRAQIDGREIVRDGTGYGDGQASADRAYSAHELAAKEAESDAMKRALSTFGDRFGLALYEKDKSKANVTSGPRNMPDPAMQAPQQDAKPLPKAKSRETYDRLSKKVDSFTNPLELEMWTDDSRVIAARKSLPADWARELAGEIDAKLHRLADNMAAA